MSGQIRKIAVWRLGMALAGAILGAKSSYSLTWYGALLDDPTFIVGGACVGLIFSLRLRVSK